MDRCLVSFYPSFRSALTCRLFLNRLPIEDCLSRIGFQLASRCSVCGVSSESSDHLFLWCPIATALWETVFSAFQRRISVDSWSSFFSQAYVNNDGAALSSQGAGGCGGALRNCGAFMKGYFAVPFDQVFAFEAKLLAALMAINFSWKNGWHRSEQGSLADSACLEALYLSDIENGVEVLISLGRRMRLQTLFLSMCWGWRSIRGGLTPCLSAPCWLAMIACESFCFS
ncbi:hypothetical protein Dsin_009551 [Dipteronia sinensis]|uniref:Reverse transcriptase zinc-binding domain-containing protein n=1 Tax=Dipteronia sinensis TaxID=43782 RepID=A0AAE0AQW0_9ROSI|nr:hypothetical protein Dsin_009551 [Dipteronia sinensis]